MDWAPLVELRVIDGIRQQAWRQRLKNFWRLRGIMGGAGAACTRRAQTPLDTLLLPGPFREPGLNRAATGQARVLWGRRLGRHRQSVKPHVRPLAPRPAGVLCFATPLHVPYQQRRRRRAAHLHGKWRTLFRDWDDRAPVTFPFRQRIAEMLIAIVEHSILSNDSSNLPPSWGTLYEMTRTPSLKREIA